MYDKSIIPAARTFLYNVTTLLMRLQIKFMLTVLCTLSQILPYACKSLWRKNTHTHTHARTHAHKLPHTWRSQFKNRANHQLSKFLQKARSSLKYESVRSGLLNKWAGHVRVIMYSFETHLTRSDLFTSLSSAGVFNAARVRQQIRLTLHLIF